MAVRDKQRHQHDDLDREWLKLVMRNALDHLPGLVIAGGLLLYGYLSLNYYSFYGQLGVDPNDVGLSYTGTLARSTGFVLVYSLPALGLLLPSTRRYLGASRWVRKAQQVMWGLTALILVMAVGSIHGVASAAVQRVEAGEPVRPLQFQLPLLSMKLVLLAIHADPTYVEPTGKPGEFPGVERLRHENLLYLGQSSGTVVLYNPDLQEAVYMPASSIVLHVRDCSDHPVDPCWP